MLSSLNAFGGLSAADLLTLFGSNSSSMTPASTVRSALAGAATSNANDPVQEIKAIVAQAQSGSGPAEVIKAILAQAQIEQAETATVERESTISFTAEAAYADQMGSPGTEASTSGAISAPEAVQSNASEQSGIGVATQAAYAALSAVSAADPANGNGIAAISAQERSDAGITRGLIISVLGNAESAAAPDSSSSVASASATFLAPDAYQQLVAGGGSAISLATATYAGQMDSSGSIGAANVTLSLPDTAQQIAYAVALISSNVVYGENTGVISVTAADAVNVTVDNGALSLTGAQGAPLPSGLPSLAAMQQAIDQEGEDLPNSYPARNGLDLSTYQGSLTLIKLPPDALYAVGDNFTVLSEDSQWDLSTDDKWAVVLPQDTVTVTVSNAQSSSSADPSSAEG